MSWLSGGLGTALGGVAGFMVGGPVGAALGASLGGALGGAADAKDAARIQADAANRATDISNAQYRQTREDNAPWRAAGLESLQRLQELMNNGTLTSRFNGQDVANEPGYAFGLNQGQKEINARAAASGGFGGDTLKAATRYAQDYAGTKYGQAFDRWRMEQGDIYNRLAGVAGVGQQTNAANSSAGLAAAQAASSNMLGAANAQAASRIARGNIYGNAVNQLAAYGLRSYNSTPNGYGISYDQATSPTFATQQLPW